MANDTEAAAWLPEIGFPEFTAKLITDTFDALVSANLRQTEAYIELVEQVAKPLTEYINDTQEDISGEQLLQFLAAALPPAEANSEEPTKVAAEETLTQDDADTLNAALALPVEADPNDENQVAVAGQLDQDGVDLILNAVAKRVAASRHSLLSEMVKTGILRLVVENGLIETRLTFTTYTSTFLRSHATSYNRSTYRRKSRDGTGGLVALFGHYASRTRQTSVGIRTTDETQRDTSGSQVQVFGLVRINFKTDYVPLST